MEEFPAGESADRAKPDIERLLEMAGDFQRAEGPEAEIDPELIRKFLAGELDEQADHRVAVMIAKYQGWFARFLQEWRGGSQ